MKTLKLNNNGDLEFDSRMNLAVVDEINEVKQRIGISLKTNKGEWFLNILFGVPWIELLSNGEPPERFRKEVIKVLNNDQDVEEVLSVTTDFNIQDRKLTIDFEVKINDEVISESVVIE